MTLPVEFPTLPSLDLFVSVVELGSVGRAARAHGISQPSASARLDDLERRLGIALLDRGPSGSSPTASGSLVAGWANSLLTAAADLAAAAEALRSDAAGEVRVIASYTVAEYLLPAWLGRYQRSRPETIVELAVANSVDVLDAIRHGRAELGFVELVEAVPGLASAVVGSDELVAVVASDHPWAARPGIDAATLVGVPLIAREHGSGTRAAFESAVAAAGLARPVAALELGSTSAVKAAVAAGSSPAVLSRLAVEADVANGRLSALEVEGLDLKRALRMLWRTDRPLPVEAERLRSHLLA